MEQLYSMEKPIKLFIEQTQGKKHETILVIPGSGHPMQVMMGQSLIYALAEKVDGRKQPEEE